MVAEMRALALCLATGLFLTLSGCQMPLFDNGFGDISPRRDRGRDVDTPARSVAVRQNRDANLRVPSPRQNLDPARLASLNTFLQRGNLSLKNNALADARIQFETALQIDPRNAHALHMMGRIGDQEGRFEDAEYHYMLALASGRNANLLSDLGYSFMQQGKLDRAREYLLKALEDQPDHRMATINLGAVYAWSGDQEGALAWLRQVGTHEQAVASLNDILRTRPPGGGGGTQTAEQQPPEDPKSVDYQTMRAQMAEVRRREQAKRRQKEQAEEWQARQRIDAMLNEGIQSSLFESEGRHREPAIRHAIPPGMRSGGAGGAGSPPMPLEIGPNGFVPASGQSVQERPRNQSQPPAAQPYYGGNVIPSAGQGDSAMPEQWPHQSPPSNALIAPNGFGQQLPPGAGANPNIGGGSTGQQFPPRVTSGQIQQFPQNYQMPGNSPQNQPVRTIEQTANWNAAGQRNQAANAAARMGMSAGPGGLFPVNSQPAPGSTQQNVAPQNGPQPQNNYGPASPPARAVSQQDVWRPGQQNPGPHNSGQQNFNQGVVPGGAAPAAPSHINWNQLPPSQTHQIPSPTWNMNTQQPLARQG
jgi:tetratricopeptide (TPR) repeat protein